MLAHISGRITFFKAEITEYFIFEGEFVGTEFEFWHTINWNKKRTKITFIGMKNRKKYLSNQAFIFDYFISSHINKNKMYNNNLI